jgi:PAS domain S-box-containing protein
MNIRHYAVYLFIPAALLPVCYWLYSLNDFHNFSSAVVSITLGFFALLFFILNHFNQKTRLKEEREKWERLKQSFSIREEEYISLIENTGGVVYRCDHLGNFTFLSKKCFELTGYTNGELRGKHFTFLITDDWKTSVLEFYQYQNSNLIPETIHCFPIVSKDGYKKWVEQTVVLLHDGQYRVGYQGIVTDITDKKLGENLLREANQKLLEEKMQANIKMQAILDHLPLMVYLKDLQGRYLMVNKEFHRAFNTTDKEVIRQKPGEFNKYVKDSLDYQVTDQMVLDSLQRLEKEDTVMTVKGLRSMMVTKFPLFGSEGHVFEIVGLNMDITEGKY